MARIGRSFPATPLILSGPNLPDERRAQVSWVELEVPAAPPSAFKRFLTLLGVGT